MNEIKLLILDDNQRVIDSYNKTIKRINRDGEITYQTYTATTLDEAKAIIKYHKLDTAIIDLNLCSERTDPDNADGNEAIKELMKNFRMPIFVVSGEITKLEEELEENPLIKVYLREKFEEEKGLEEIITLLYNSKSMHYFSRDGYLEEMINNFYWKSLSKTMESWQEVENKYPDDIEKILSRHTMSSLNEQLYVNGNVGSFDKYHPGEMYIIPPIKQHYHTGDIIEKDGKKFIIINPACDIVNKDKMEYYTLAKIVKAIDLPKIKAKSEANKNSYINDNLKKVNKLDRYHFLPKFDIIDNDFIIDFQCLSIVEIGEITKTNYEDYIIEREANINEYTKIASVASPFLKDIIARFSAYYARQGQPNLL